MQNILGKVLVREDVQYDIFVAQYQAKSVSSKVFYLSFHLVPGVLAYVLINLPSIHAWVLRATGLSDPMLQGCCILAVFFIWHLIMPFVFLRWVDRLSFKESLRFLSLDRFDSKGVLLVLPAVFALFTICSLPYMKYVFPVLSDWIAKIPLLDPPAYSIYRDPSAVYNLFPAWFVALGLLGNFLCEEIYFRGYLLKKIGFLGSSAWIVNSILFALYHLWQAPTTWALIGPAFVFGLLIRWRKNLYPLIAFHFLINIVWGTVIGALLGS